MNRNGIELVNIDFFLKEKRPILGVLFDMDGIILDTEKLYTRFWQEAAIALGYPMTRELALKMRSTNHTAGEAQIKSWFGPDARYHDIRAKRIELMTAFIEKEGVDLKPGIHELLDYLQANRIKTAIATSSALELAIKYLTQTNLADRFDKIITAYMVEQGKPEPYIYLRAAKELGLDPKNCIALEDSPSGLTSACRAGCLPVMIPDQDQPDEETKKLLFAKADRLDQVIQLIEWTKSC